MVCPTSRHRAYSRSVKVGKTLATRRARLKVRNGACRFGKTIFIKRSKVGRKTTRLRLKISFKGNAALSAGSATNTLVVRKQGAGAAHRGRDGAPSRPPRARYRLLATRPEEIDPWP